MSLPLLQCWHIETLTSNVSNTLYSLYLTGDFVTQSASSHLLEYTGAWHTLHVAGALYRGARARVGRMI